MEQARYPLHIIHQYTVHRRSVEAFLEIVAGMSRRSLERITTSTASASNWCRWRR